MDKVQGSYKLEWLYGYMVSGYIFTSSKKVTDYEAYLNKKNILWMKTNHYPSKIKSHLVTIVGLQMTPFTLKSTSKLRSLLHFRYSTVIPCFNPPANMAQF